MTKKLNTYLSDEYPDQLFTIFTSDKKAHCDIWMTVGHFVMVTGQLMKEKGLVIRIAFIPAGSNMPPTVKELHDDCDNEGDVHSATRAASDKCKALFSKAKNSVTFAAYV